MASLRKLVRNQAVRNALSWIAAGYIRLVWLTGRWRVVNGSVLADRVADGRPVIVCFWHGRMLMMPNVRPSGAPMTVLISHHRDGVFISRTLAHLGVDTIAGSTSRGGGNALIAMVHALRRGVYVAITPDGPRGPRMRVAPGAVTAAKLSGACLVPASYSARWRRVSGSWDRMLIPLPFTRGIVRFGTPIEVPRNADEAVSDRLRRKLETDLIELTDALDSEMGVTPIAPEAEAASQGLTAAGGAK